MQSFIPQWFYEFLCNLPAVMSPAGRRQLRLGVPVLLAVLLLVLLIRTVNAHGVSPVTPPLLPACYAADLRCTGPDPQHQSALFPSSAIATALTETPPYDGKWLQLMPGLVDAANHLVITPSALFDVPCVAGFADVYPCDHVDLLAYLPPSAIGGQTNNDNWGWRDPVDGTEYALIGATDGVVFLDISTPTAPLYLGKLPSHGTISSWRDLKVYQDHAFVVADYNRDHGMQVFDLRQLHTVDRNAIPVVFQESAHYAGFADAHNVAINEASGYAYAVGTRTCDGGLHIVDIRDPRAPVEAGCYAADGYIHDTQCVTYHGPDTRYLGRELCFNASVSQVTIVDVTEKRAPVRLGTIRDEQSAYIHQGWLTADQRYFVMNDEMDELFGLQQTSSYVIDVQQLDAPRLIGQYSATLSSIDHNLYISDTYIYEANYTSGLRLLDGKDLAEGQLREVASFDTFPEHDDPVFLGAWTAYPYFKDGTVVVSTLDRGVFILRPRLAADVLVESPPATALLCRVDLANKPFTTTIALQPRNHYTQNVTLALGDLPPLVTATLAPTVIDLQARRSATSTLTADLQLVADGLYTVTVAATSPAAVPLDRATVALHLATTAATTPTVFAPTLPLTSSTLALTWQPLTTAARYRVELAADAQFAQVIEQDETMATTHRLQTPLALNARYFWRVTPLNGCGAGPAADGRLQTAVGLFLPLVMQ
jgi:choice-of-anchor B domain-containing protein